jgi:hypothetical protein
MSEQTKPEPSEYPNVYRRFCEEVDALVIGANDSAVSVVGELTHAVKRAQMVVDGELLPVAERREQRNADTFIGEHMPDRIDDGGSRS